jgi:hypothetical protein
VLPGKPNEPLKPAEEIEKIFELLISGLALTFSAFKSRA